MNPPRVSGMVDPNSDGFEEAAEHYKHAGKGFSYAAKMKLCVLRCCS